MATTKKTFIGIPAGGGTVSTMGAVGAQQVVNAGNTPNPDGLFLVTDVDGAIVLCPLAQNSVGITIGSHPGAAYQPGAPAYVWGSLTGFAFG